MKKKITKNKYIFIDTNIFVNIISSDKSINILKDILNSLDNNKIILILPEVILKEIKKEFLLNKKEITSIIKQQFITEKDFCLGGKNTTNRNSGINNNKLINDSISNDRERILETVEKLYNEIETEIENIFQHKNTKIIDITNDIIMHSIRRSLLKKAPSTRLDKNTETQHTKDIDCVAFESILYFFSKINTPHTESSINFIVQDSDYYDLDSNKKNIHPEIFCDLNIYIKKVNISITDSIESLFNKKIKNSDISQQSLPSLNIIEESNKKSQSVTNINQNNF